MDEFEFNIESWVQLMKQEKIEIQVSVQNLPYVYDLLLNHFKLNGITWQLFRPKNRKKLNDMKAVMKNLIKIVVNNRIFGINLFISLAFIKDFIDSTQFDVRYERVGERIESMKSVVKRIKELIELKDIYLEG